MSTLYREYRPRRFDEFIDRDVIITTLKNQIKSGRIGHAYLFAGSRGTGKTSCARVLARAVNCLHPVDGNPCGECEVCKRLAKEDNVDIVEMDAASNNGVDDARDIREKVKYLPVSCKYKVYIIDEVHMLTGGAFNALLKTIEEPPEHVIFILATTEPQKLPQTILSRCMRFDFGLVSTEALAKHIASVYDKEGVKYTDDAVYEIARLGAGSVRDALSVADTIMAAADTITADVVLSMTGAGDSLKISKLFDSLTIRDLKSALNLIDDFSRSGKSMSAVCSQLIAYARDVLVLKSIGTSAFDGLISADRTAQEYMLSSAQNPSLDDLSRILSQLSASENGLKYSVNPRVYLETALIKLISGIAEEEDLKKRVAALERRLSVNVGEQKKK
ncbi:MAG: DNA polymerase III subunit gamma/tau [Clostridiales bacterium]|nr:DNA polymerase III subunit gamma/tau [Clostridiales bacterium]